MIKLEQVTKYYPTPSGRKYILRDADLEIPTGHNVAILGMNGAGKSTLLRLLGGIDSPNSGKITIDMNISWPIGLAGGLQGAMSGRDNAKFVCRIFGDGYEQMKARVAMIEDQCQLGKYFDMPVQTYSSGMKSKIKLAISVAFDFDCYLFDELNAVGDALFRKQTESMFASKKGKANFIIVSHNINELMTDCDMAVVLHQGELRSFSDVLAGVDYYYQVTKVPKKDALLKKLEKSLNESAAQTPK